MSNQTGKTQAVLFLLCVSVTALADTLPLEHSIRDACSDRYFAQVDVQACVRQDAERSATAWRNAQAQAIAKMQQWDEEPKYTDAALKQYHAAEQAFVAYRNRYCDWAAAQSERQGKCAKMRALPSKTAPMPSSCSK